MTRLVPKAEWVPQDVTLEPTAHTVATSEASACVVAGPGAGKTELLAQRACYLLQTGTCPNPKRILAISFKRDAARTLRERVERRAGEFSVRFESYTFDAFAKSLLDRFLVCLPTQWRPPADYKIATWYEPDVESFLRGLRPPPQLGTTHNLAAIKEAISCGTVSSANDSPRYRSSRQTSSIGPQRKYGSTPSNTGACRFR